MSDSSRPSLANSKAVSRLSSRLPTRSNSMRRGPAPADSLAPDDKAIEDLYQEVESTGSIEAAAAKLHQVAQMRKMQAWEDDPEEAAYLAGTNGGGPSATTQSQEEDESALDDGDDEYYNDEEGYEYQEGDEDDDTFGGGGEVVHLQEIVEGLWVGDLVAAMDLEGLEQRGITNILSLLRPKLKFGDQFSVYPLEIDDSADTDILSHLPTCVAWIGEALRKREIKMAGKAPFPGGREKVVERLEETKPGGVLVHCQAGMSRSATVTAAYLMVALDIGPEEAVEMIKEKRPVIDPSETFRYQLGLFSNTNGKVSLRDRSTRQFYMERTTSQFINGDGGAPPMDKMAKYPATPTPSNPPTPSGGHGRRKIRCKACRRHLAVREHMMDHILDQAPVSRPRTPSLLSLPSPRSSDGPTPMTQTRKNSISDVVNPLTGVPVRSRHSSMSNAVPPLMSPVAESNFDTELNREMRNGSGSGEGGMLGVPSPRKSSFKRMEGRPSLESLRITNTASPGPMSPGQMSRSRSQEPSSRSQDNSTSTGSASPGTTNGPSIASNGRYQSADQLNSRLPPHLLALRNGGGGGSPSGHANTTSPTDSPAESPPATSHGQTYPPTGAAVSRRKSLLAMTPTEGRERRGSGSSINGLSEKLADSLQHTGGTPILVNPKCSGYFVEPLTWMEPFLANGAVQGKIVCPNEKCGVKIGNFDWAGVQCGCKEWVTPGFCIHRSKVDEVW